MYLRASDFIFTLQRITTSFFCRYVTICCSETFYYFRLKGHQFNLDQAVEISCMGWEVMRRERHLTPEHCRMGFITHSLCKAVPCVLTWAHKNCPININVGFHLPACAPIGSTEVNSMPAPTYGTSDSYVGAHKFLLPDACSVSVQSENNFLSYTTETYTWRLEAMQMHRLRSTY